MSLTSIVGKAFLSRQKSLEHHTHDAEALQREVFDYLIAKGKGTEYGRKHLFSTIKSYEDFADNVPVNTYEELKDDIDRIPHGETNVLWPRLVTWSATKSGK